jgi:hypothetical protein
MDEWVEEIRFEDLGVRGGEESAFCDMGPVVCLCYRVKGVVKVTLPRRPFILSSSPGQC